MLRGAAVVPAAPLLVPALAPGDDAATAALRAATAAVVAELAAWAIPVVVVGGGEGTGWFAAPGPHGLGGHGVAVPQAPPQATNLPAPFGVPTMPAGTVLPRSLGLGAWLLAAAGATWGGGLAVAAPAPSEACAALGRDLVAAADTEIALLVVGDGTARTGASAPGYADDRSAAHHREATAALASGDPARVMQLDVDLAADLLAEGRAAWQVLAGAAAAGPAWTADVSYDDAPFGVATVIATWRRSP
jgi:hypothetical protein